MKQFLVALGAIIFSFSTLAQTMVKEMNGADTRFIPGKYMKSGEAAIYFSGNEYGYDDGQANYEAQIFDFALNPLKSFKFQVLQPYTVAEQRVSNGTKELTKVISQNRMEIYGLPSVTEMEVRKNAFINWVYDENRYLDSSISIESLTARTRVQGNTVYIVLPLKTDYIQYGEYLKTIEVYLDESNQYGYNYTYSTIVPVCDGEWSKSTLYDVPVSNFCTPRCVDVAGMEHWHGGVYLPFSQTFFNDDDNYEYVRYKIEIEKGYGEIYEHSHNDNSLKTLFGITDTDRDGDGIEDYRSTYYGIKRTGFEVVSEDGSVIYSFSLPEYCENNPNIEFFKSDDSILAQIEFTWRDENDNYMRTVRFYRVDKSSGITKIVKEENHVKTSPNPVSAGNPIRLSIPKGNNNNRLIEVASVNGSRVYSKQLDTEDTEIFVPIYNLSAGVYVYSVTEGDKILGNGKIIIR